MADPAWWPEQADVERKLRNAAGLLMLGDPDGTGTLDPNFLANCLASARGRVRGAVMVKHAASVLDALDAETVADLKRIAVIYAAAVAWSDGVGGQRELPPGLQQDVAWADAECEKIATGKRFLGGASGMPSAPLAQKVGSVDPDPRRTGVSVASLRRWGFR